MVEWIGVTEGPMLVNLLMGRNMVMEHSNILLVTNTLESLKKERWMGMQSSLILKMSLIQKGMVNGEMGRGSNG